VLQGVFLLLIKDPFLKDLLTKLETEFDLWKDARRFLVDKQNFFRLCEKNEKPHDTEWFKDAVREHLGVAS
jgi:hypothetical protein